MSVMQRFQTTKMDVDRVRQLLVDRKEDLYVRERMSENVLGPARQFDRENFWYVHLGCLLTTQQRSTAGSPVDRFLSLKPFPLSIGRCGNNVEKVVLQALKSFGIGKNRTIAQRASTNQSWLNKDGWPRVQRWFDRLEQNSAPLRLNLDIPNSNEKLLVTQQSTWKGLDPNSHATFGSGWA
jgi:hypothetical protein